MSERILIIGSGGREHALGWKIKQSPDVEKIYFAPGNVGTQTIGQNLDISVNEIDRLRQFSADNEITRTIVGPEVPLELGIVNAYNEDNLPILGPTKEAALLETNKAWAIRFMERHKIPHPPSKIFNDPQEAIDYINNQIPTQIVIKASGLAAGKGVILPDSKEEAHQAIKRIMIDKEIDRGDTVIIQKRLKGGEVSLLAITDGKTIVPFLPAQDFKRAFDGDQGPNTGGMGSIAPTPTLTPQLSKQVFDTILKPAVDGIREEGNQYKGILYAGLMITDDGPKVLEFNARFGDPETQPLMLLLSSDLNLAIKATIEENLTSQNIAFRKGYAICVVLASEGYPDKPQTGQVIYGLEKIESLGVEAFHAGTTTRDGQTVVSSGRVIGLTAWDQNPNKARQKLYAAIGPQGIHFQNMFFRADLK